MAGYIGRLQNYSDFEPEQFTGNGTNKTFVLQKTSITTNSVLVIIDGLKMEADPVNYGIVGNTLVFVTAPANGASIEVVHLGLPGSPMVTNDETVDATKINGADATAIKAKLGMSNVDNTSDVNKPISNAVNTSLNDRFTKAEINAKFDGLAGVTNIPNAQTKLDVYDKASVDGKIDDLSGVTNATAARRNISAASSLDVLDLRGVGNNWRDKVRARAKLDVFSTSQVNSIVYNNRANVVDVSITPSQVIEVSSPKSNLLCDFNINVWEEGNGLGQTNYTKSVNFQPDISKISGEDFSRAVTLTISNVDKTATLASGIWTNADIGRIIYTTDRVGSASIIGFTSGVANLVVDEYFSGTSYTTGNWALHEFQISNNTMTLGKTVSGSKKVYHEPNISVYDTLQQHFCASAVDSQGHIHFVWSGRYKNNSVGGGGFQLHYATNASGQWVYTPHISKTVSEPTRNYLAVPSIAIDSNDKIHIACHGKSVASPTYDVIMYTTNVSGSWYTKVNISSLCWTTYTPHQQGFPSIAVDGANKVIIAWHGLSSADGYSKYKIHLARQLVAGSSDFVNGWEGVHGYTDTISTANVHVRPNLSVDNTGKVCMCFDSRYYYFTNMASHFVHDVSLNSPQTRLTVNMLNINDVDGAYSNMYIDSSNYVHAVYSAYHSPQPNSSTKSMGVYYAKWLLNSSTHTMAAQISIKRIDLKSTPYNLSTFMTPTVISNGNDVYVMWSWHRWYTTNPDSNTVLAYSRDGGGSWSLPVSVSDNPGNMVFSGQLQYSPVSGEVHCAFMENPNGVQTASIARNVQNYRSWYDLVITPSSTTNQTNPQLEVDTHNVSHVVWQDYSISGYSHIQYATNATGIWVVTSLIDVNLTGSNTSLYQHSYDPQLELDSNGDVHVTWWGLTINSTAYYKISYRNNINGVWSATETVDFTAQHCQQPQLALDSANGIHFVWQEYLVATAKYIISYRSRSASGQWTTVENISMLSSAFDSYTQQMPQIAIDKQDDSIHVTWKGSNSTNSYPSNRLNYAVNDNTGSGWKTFSDISTLAPGNPAGYTNVSHGSNVKNHILKVDSTGMVYIFWTSAWPYTFVNAVTVLNGVFTEYHDVFDHAFSILEWNDALTTYSYTLPIVHSIGIDSTDTVHVLYDYYNTTYPSTAGLRYAKGDYTGWEGNMNVTNDPATPFPGTGCLYVGQLDNISMVYSSSTGSNSNPKKIYFGTDGVISNNYIKNKYIPFIYSDVDSSVWTDLVNATVDEDDNGGEVYFTFIIDGVHKIVGTNQTAVRSVVQWSGTAWQYNSNATYTGTTWTNASTNTELAALAQSMNVASNRMSGAWISQVSDAQLPTLGITTFAMGGVIYTPVSNFSPEFRDMQVDYSSTSVWKNLTHNYEIEVYNNNGVYIKAPVTGTLRNIKVVF